MFRWVSRQQWLSRNVALILFLDLDSSSEFSSGGSKSETTSCDCSVSDLQTPPPVSTHSRGYREKLDCEKQDQHSTPDKKEKHQIHQSSPTKNLPHKEKFRELIVTSDLDGRHSGSLDRKRQFECEGINKAKRMRHEMSNSPFGSSQTLQYYPSPFITTYTHPPAHNMQVQHTNMSDCSFLYPNSIRFNASYPDTKTHPCQTSSWETMRDTHSFHFRKHTLKDYSLNTCKAIRKPLVARGSTSPLYFLRVRETLLSREVSTPLQTPAASYWLWCSIGTLSLQSRLRKGELTFSNFISHFSFIYTEPNKNSHLKALGISE